MEMSAWLALRASDALKADERVAVVKSKNWETWGAPQYSLDKFVLKVDSEKGELKMQTKEVDHQGQPFYALTLHADGKISENMSKELPFTPMIVMSSGSILQAGW